MRAVTCQVAVRFLGFLERLAGRREMSLTVEDSATVLDVLTLLAERFGPQFTSSVFRAPREVHTHFRVFLNEEEAGVDDPVAPPGGGPLEVALLIMPVFEGGCP